MARVAISAMEVSEGRNSERFCPEWDPSVSHRERQDPIETTYAATIAALSSLIAGLQKRPLPASLAISGKTYTNADLVQAIQPIIESLSATVSARAAYLEATKTSEASLSGNRVLLRDAKIAIQIAYGQSDASLSDFGLAPRKSKTMTPAAHVAAAEKAKATRIARGTTSKKQKALIHGNVTGVTIAPIVTPTASAPATTTPVAPVVAAAESNGSSR